VVEFKTFHYWFPRISSRKLIAILQYFHEKNRFSVKVDGKVLTISSNKLLDLSRLYKQKMTSDLQVTDNQPSTKKKKEKKKKKENKDKDPPEGGLSVKPAIKQKEKNPTSISRVAYHINGQDIYWSWVQRLRGRVGGDWNRVMWALYNAKDKNNIIAFVEAGTGKKDYSMIPPVEWEDGRKHLVLRWWKEVSNYNQEA